MDEFKASLVSRVSQANQGYIMRPSLYKRKEKGRVGEMAQWVNAITANPDNLSLIPRTHIVEGGADCPESLTSTRTLWPQGVQVHAHTSVFFRARSQACCVSVVPHIPEDHLNPGVCDQPEQ